MSRASAATGSRIVGDGCQPKLRQHILGVDVHRAPQQPAGLITVPAARSVDPLLGDLLCVELDDLTLLLLLACAARMRMGRAVPLAERLLRPSILQEIVIKTCTFPYPLL